MSTRRTTRVIVAGLRLVQFIDKDSGQKIGQMEYEPKYGVHAARGDRGERRVFLTNGYRAAVGGEVVGHTGSITDISRAKKAARTWIEEL